MLSWKDQVLSKDCEYKLEHVKCVAKSTIVANFHIWRFCVEKLQNKTIMINVMQRHGIAWYEAEGQAKWLGNLYPELIMIDSSDNH